MRVRVSKSKLIDQRSGLQSRMKALSAVAAEFSAFRPAPQVLTRVRAVPTIFPQFDKITRVGGLPIERFNLLHGPSGGGKTYFSIGVLLSFLLRDHFAVLIDAERTTPITWLEKAMGEYAQHPFFLAERPETYEKTVDKVQSFVTKLKALRTQGKVKPSTSGVIVVDSIRKLVPQDQFAKIMKESKAAKAGDKSNVRNRLAQIKAQMNAAWLDDLVPLLEQTSTSMLVIAREMIDTEAPPPRAFQGRKPEPTMKTGGGGALFYDASLDIRCSRVRQYGKKTEDRFHSYGDIHRIDITKSKVSGKEEYRASCNFHISNGVSSPPGFDRARDVLELARAFDVVKGTNWLIYRDKKWRSEDAAAKILTEQPELRDQIEAECRELFKGEETRLVT